MVEEFTDFLLRAAAQVEQRESSTESTARVKSRISAISLVDFDITIIPSDIWKNILSYLPFKALLLLRLTNSFFHQLSAKRIFEHNNYYLFKNVCKHGDVKTFSKIQKTLSNQSFQAAIKAGEFLSLRAVLFHKHIKLLPKLYECTDDKLAFLMHNDNSHFKHCVKSGDVEMFKLLYTYAKSIITETNPLLSLIINIALKNSQVGILEYIFIHELHLPKNKSTLITMEKHKFFKLACESANSELVTLMYHTITDPEVKKQVFFALDHISHLINTDNLCILKLLFQWMSQSTLRYILLDNNFVGIRIAGAYGNEKVFEYFLSHPLVLPFHLQVVTFEDYSLLRTALAKGHIGIFRKTLSITPTNIRQNFVLKSGNLFHELAQTGMIESLKALYELIERADVKESFVLGKQCGVLEIAVQNKHYEVGKLILSWIMQEQGGRYEEGELKNIY